MSNNEEKLAERFPSTRDTWPPRSVTAPVGVVPAENDTESAEPPSVRDNSSVRDNPSVDPLVALRAAVHDLDLARHEARRCREATLAARGAFGKALEAWNRTQPVQTQEQALRDYVNTSQLERARRAAAGQGVYYPGVTRTAKAIGGGGLGVQQGGGRSYRRGAYSKAEAMTIEANKLRAAAAAAAKPTGQR